MSYFQSQLSYIAVSKAFHSGALLESYYLWIEHLVILQDNQDSLMWFTPGSHCVPITPGNSSLVDKVTLFEQEILVLQRITYVFATT